MFDIIPQLHVLGITENEIIVTALELYQPYKVSQQQAHDELAAMIKKEMKNITISSLISAAIHLDATGMTEDPDALNGNKKLYSPAIIGSAIAESIGGSYAYFEYTRFSRKSPGILKITSPFLREALAGLMAGCTSRLYSTALPVEE